MERYPTLAEAVASFSAELELRGRATTAKNYLQHLKFLLRHLPDAHVHQVTASDIERIARIRSRDVKEASLRTWVYAVRSFFRWAVERGYAHANPALATPHPPLRPPEHRWLSERQLRAMWNAAVNDDDRLILLFAGAAGLRAGECLGLRYRDIDAEEHLAHVLGKGKRPREVAMDAIGLQLISLRCGKPNDRILIRLRYGGFRKRVVLMGQRAGILHVTPHMLRHSFAMLFLEHSGGDAFALQDLLGHVSSTMTGYYVRSYRQRNATRRAREVGLGARLFGSESLGGTNAAP